MAEIDKTHPQNNPKKSQKPTVPYHCDLDKEEVRHCWDSIREPSESERPITPPATGPR